MWSSEELAGLKSQCDGTHGRMNKLIAEEDAVAACEDRAIENLQAAEVAGEGILRDVTTAKRRQSWMKVALISLCTEVDD